MLSSSSDPDFVSRGPDPVWGGAAMYRTAVELRNVRRLVSSENPREGYPMGVLRAHRRLDVGAAAPR